MFTSFTAEGARRQMGERCLMSIIDIHAHATKRGSFIFGNAPHEEALASGRQAQEVLERFFLEHVATNLLPAALSLLPRAQVEGAGASPLLPWFSLQASEVSSKSMWRRDKRGEGADGSLRVGAYRASGLVLAYTLETHYHGRWRVGRRQSLPPDYELRVSDFYTLGTGLVHALALVVSLFAGAADTDTALAKRVLRLADQRSRTKTSPLSPRAVSELLLGAARL